MQLINWQKDQKKFFSVGQKSVSEYQTLLATKKRPQEVENLIIELDRMWKRLNVHCGSCFAGKIPGQQSRKGRGCCSNCPNLGETKCVAKPIGCAVYTCGTMQFTGQYFTEDFEGKLTPRIAEVIGRVRSLSSLVWKMNLWTVYAEGYLHECDRQWSTRDIENVQLLTRMAEEIYL